MRDIAYRSYLSGSHPDIEEEVRRVIQGTSADIEKYSNGIHNHIVDLIKNKIQESISKVQELEEETKKGSTKKLASLVKDLQEILSEVEEEVRSTASDITPRQA